MYLLKIVGITLAIVIGGLVAIGFLVGFADGFVEAGGGPFLLLTLIVGFFVHRFFKRRSLKSANSNHTERPS
jgi:hypothetical protein